jgi:dipeptidyl aminopeptidase/acylaminoacyl peptidase
MVSRRSKNVSGARLQRMTISLCRLNWLASAALLLSGAVAEARDLTVEDMLDMEGMGEVTFSPDGHRILIERKIAYRLAPRFNRDFFNGRDRSQLLEADLSEAGKALPLRGMEKPGGAWLGSWSPGGGKAAVFWLEGDVLRTGIVSGRAATPTALTINPDFSILMTAPEWVSEDALVYVELPSGRKPFLLSIESAYADQYPPMWKDAITRGKASASVLYSGAAGENTLGTPATLVLMRADNTGRRDLATGHFQQIAVSPDRRYVAAVREGSQIVPRSDVPLAHATGARLRDLLLIDLKSPAPPKILCADCDLGVTPVDWSSDSDALLVYDGGRGKSGVASLRVFGTDGDERSAGLSRLSWGGDWFAGRLKAAAATLVGDRLWALGRLDGAGREDWYAISGQGTFSKLTGFLSDVPRRLIASAAGGAFMIAGDELWFVKANAAPRRITSVAGGKVEGIPANDGYGGPAAATNPAHIVVRRTTAQGAELLFVDTRTFAMTRVALISPADDVLAVSAKSPGAVVRSKPGSGVYLLSAGRPARLLTEINRHLADVQPPEIRKLTRKDRSGTQVVDWLLLPHDRAKPAGDGAPSPLSMVIYLYPGRVENPRASGFETIAERSNYSASALLARGYAVLLPSIPIEYGHAGPGELVEPIGIELNAAADAAVATGLVDPDRLAVMGHSFGGYGVLAALCATDRFKAGIALAGFANLSSTYGQFDIRRRLESAGALNLFNASLSETGQIPMSAPPWKDPQRYVRNSPVFLADRITTPVMIIQGDFDYLSMTQGEEMFTALYRQGKDATFLRYWGEGHILANPGTLVDLDRRVPEFLDRAFALRGRSMKDARLGQNPVR